MAPTLEKLQDLSEKFIGLRTDLSVLLGKMQDIIDETSRLIPKGEINNSEALAQATNEIKTSQKFFEKGQYVLAQDYLDYALGQLAQHFGFMS